MSDTVTKYVVLRSMLSSHDEMKAVFRQAIDKIARRNQYLGSINKDMYHRNSGYAIEYRIDNQPYFDLVVRAVRDAARKVDHSNHSDVIVKDSRNQLSYYGL